MRFDSYLITESINDKGIFKACFMAGTPGAGKSYVIDKISGGVQPKMVNTDTWTEFLKALNAEGWEGYGERIKYLTQAQLTNYLNSLLPLWIDGTSSNPPSLFRRQGLLKSLGYDTAMIWVNTDLDVAIARAEERGKTGRQVPTKEIIKIYKEITHLKSYYQSQFDVFEEVSNNDGELTDKVILSLYRKMDNFFSSPVKNPIGQANIKKMKDEKVKYYEEMSGMKQGEISKLVQGWYR